MSTLYDVNMSIKVLFDQIEDFVDYAAAGNSPKTPEQIFMTGQQLITETDMFTDEIKICRRLPALDKTWTKFKTHFTLARQELREDTTASNLIVQANNVTDNTELSGIE